MSHGHTSRFSPNQYEFVLLVSSILCPLVSRCSENINEGGEEDPPVSVLVCTVQESEAKVSRRYPARVRAIEKVDIVSRLSADLLEVGFTEGMTVKRGQCLYRLDDTRYAVAVSNQLARVCEAEAKLDLAKITLTRKEKLAEKDIATRAELDEARSEKLAQEAQLAAERALLALARDDLAHTRIVAPISGRIGLTAQTAGNYITPETGVLATIIRTDPVRVRFSLSMSDYARLFACDESRLKTEGKIAIQTASGTILPIEGRIEFVDAHAVDRTDTVQVNVCLPNRDGCLVPDSAVTLILVVSIRGTMPWVPPQAVMDDGEETYVYAVEDGKAMLRTVVAATRLPDRVYVSSGLKSGETVIIGGTHKVSDGTPVSVCKERP